MKTQLGKLTKVDLRDIWETEDKDFTPWLAEEENMAQLGDAIGINLHFEAKEKTVGPFRADIVATDIATTHLVLIENQLELTDHTHLGQIMTYAAGLDACYIIWIAKQFTEEHRAALDWLNSITGESINFFGIEIEVLKIGTSLSAPMFKVVAKPNGWSKSVKAATNAELSDMKIKQREYWIAFREYANKVKVPFNVHKPLPQNWTNIAMGHSHIYLSLSVNSLKGTIYICLQIDSPNKDVNKKWFESLKHDYEEAASVEISPDLQWESLDDNKVSMITLSTPLNFLDSSTHKQQFEWFIENTIKFQKFFKDKIKKLKM